MGMNVFDRNAGFATGQAQVWGFDKSTGIDSKSYGAPGAKIFYVDPNNAQAVDFGNLGEDPTVPLATVQAAVALCRDHQGDTIVIGANDAWQYAPHNRPLSITESLVIPTTKGGIRITGAATNPLSVQWQAVDDNQACITVRAIDVLIEGIAFVQTGGLAGTTGVFLEWTGATGYGENATVRDCVFYGVAYGVTMDYSWYNQIYRNRFEECGVAAIFNNSVTGDADYLSIFDNIFTENAIALNLDASDHNFIYNNRIECQDATSLTADMIDMTGGSCVVSDNYLACTLAQAANLAPKSATDFWVFNHATNGEY